MDIRLMKQLDIAKVIKLWKKIGLRIASDEREKKECSTMLRMNQYSCFVALVDQEIIGSVFGTFNGRRAWIYHLAVDNRWQKKGIGSHLLIKAEQALIKQGATKIILGVHASNLKVIPFYEKQGFMIMNDALLFEKDHYGSSY